MDSIMLVGLCPCRINFVSVLDRQESRRDFGKAHVVRNIVTIRRLVATTYLCSITLGTYGGQQNSLHTLSPLSTTVWLQMVFLVGRQTGHLVNNGC